jgi:hypothetical protein
MPKLLIKDVDNFSLEYPVVGKSLLESSGVILLPLLVKETLYF